MSCTAQNRPFAHDATADHRTKKTTSKLICRFKFRLGADNHDTGDSTSQQEEHCLLLEQEEDEEDEQPSHFVANVASGSAGHAHQQASFECPHSHETIPLANVAEANVDLLTAQPEDCNYTLGPGETENTVHCCVEHNIQHQSHQHLTEQQDSQMIDLILYSP